MPMGLLQITWKVESRGILFFQKEGSVALAAAVGWPPLQVLHNA